MAIPTWHDMALPILELLENGQPRQVRELIDPVGDALRLSAEDRKAMLPSGQQTRLANRVYWAVSYLKKASMLTAPQRGQVQLAPEGKKVLLSPPPALTRSWLISNYDAVKTFVSHAKEDSPTDINEDPGDDETPEETLEAAYQQLRVALADELLEQVKSQPPAFFETLVVELLLKMGYGGTRRDAGKAIGKSGDGGIDGIINEDRLGLDAIYIQAKRWETVVGRPEIQAFVGALHGQKARKGIFLTTSTFSQHAREYAAAVETRVVLIDGQQLAEYMIDFGVGVTPTTTYEIKRVDSDFFTGV